MDPRSLRHDSGYKISERPKVIDYSLARGSADGEVRIGEENENEGYSDDMH